MPSLCLKPEPSVLNLVFWAVFLNLRSPVSLIPSEILCQTQGTHWECSRLTYKQLSDQQWLWNKALAPSWPYRGGECSSPSALLTSLLSVCLSDFAFLSWGWCWGTPIAGCLNNLCRWSPWLRDGNSWKQQECCRFWFLGFLVRSFPFRGPDPAVPASIPPHPNRVHLPEEKGLCCPGVTAQHPDGKPFHPSRDVCRACSHSSVPALCYLEHDMIGRFNHIWHLAWGTVSTPKSLLWPKVALMFPWETAIVAFKG